MRGGEGSGEGRYISGIDFFSWELREGGRGRRGEERAGGGSKEGVGGGEEGVGRGGRGE